MDRAVVDKFDQEVTIYHVYIITSWFDQHIRMMHPYRDEQTLIYEARKTEQNFFKHHLFNCQNKRKTKQNKTKKR